MKYRHIFVTADGLTSIGELSDNVPSLIDRPYNGSITDTSILYSNDNITSYASSTIKTRRYGVIAMQVAMDNITLVTYKEIIR